MRLLPRICLEMFFCVFINLSFLFGTIIIYPQHVLAENAFSLPDPGAMVKTSSPYTPTIMLGMTLYENNPLKFDFIVDVGDDQLEGTDLQNESQKLVNYFMATLTVPENEMWVNLSPYEKDRIVADGLGDTELGRDLLAQDYLLKQITA